MRSNRHRIEPPGKMKIVHLKGSDRQLNWQKPKVKQIIKSLQLQKQNLLCRSGQRHLRAVAVELPSSHPK